MDEVRSYHRLDLPSVWW